MKDGRSDKETASESKVNNRKVKEMGLQIF